VRTEQDRNNHVNQARADLIQFAQSHSLSALLEKTLNVAEALTGSCIGFYHFIDQEKGKIALQEWSTRTKAEFCAIEEGIESHYDIAAAGVWVDCFHQRKPVIHNDYTALPHRKGLPPGHAEVIKYLAVPVFRGDQIKAILAVGNKVDPYSQKDIDIVLLLADLAWEIVERKIGEDKRHEIESQFRQAQKMEAIGTLAGGIAHDFNNILSAIIGYSEMAYDDALNSQANPSDIAQVLAAAERAKALVKQILTFSRKVEVNFKPLDLNKQVGQAVELLNKTIPKMIDLRTQLADDLWTINADPNQIEQILLNLTVNAADAMNGEGTITLKTTNRMVHDLACITCGKLFYGSHVALEVADTGAGMDEKTLRHIFEPFYTTKEVGKGTGLGLSTVYGIVIGHQGHIICSSSPGKGSIFTIFFPAMQAEPNTTIADLLAANTDTIHKGAERILVVDDEEAILNLATRQLTRAGYNVLTANCGETALKIYREQGTTLDLVVLDLSMPGIGGYKTVQELISINPNIKVIIASGYAANGQITESLDSGAAAYVAKPFKQAELLTAVRRVLDNT
jgi:signal transduction histidine kinase/ActR/RegA family two-component response regulator